MDSRLVEPGDIFVAVKGTALDGHNFIEQALANGARYVVCQKPYNNKDNSAETIIVDDSAEAAGLLAQANTGNPASKLTNLAVTGTNGKTTVSFLVRRCIQKAGEKCGLIGTIIYDTGSDRHQACLTTPDCLDIAECQKQMVEAGCKYMVIEASSHALSQNRQAGIEFKAAAFTNLAGDHLDYHRTKEDYLAAKARLFENLPADAVAVLNKQSSEATKIARRIAQKQVKILWYAVDAPADITARIESMDLDATAFVLEYAGKKQKVVSPLLGRYNVSNHLAAAGLCLAVGLDLDTIAAGLSDLKAIPGRLEKIGRRNDFCVIVDYAHTDDALKNVLATLKPLCRGRLIVVFGCGGDRDRTKRPRMARVAEQSADLVIVTSDNPRTERPEDIINEIVAGFEKPDSPTVIIEPDRKTAVELAINSSAKNDIVLIAGKGHEDYQILPTGKIHFDDREAAREALKNEGYG